jgi:hypothetical protein
MSGLCPLIMMASAKISIVCELHILPFYKRKQIWRGQSMRRRNSLCMDFPLPTPLSLPATVVLAEVLALPTAFAKCKENVTYFALIGVFKMLTCVECEHLLELKKPGLSCDASLLHDVPDDLGSTAKKTLEKLVD